MPFKKILCAVDGSDHAHKAQELAIELANSSGAELLFLHGMLLNAPAEELHRFAQIEGLEKTVQPTLDTLRALQGRLEYGYEEPPVGSRVYAEIGQSILDAAKSDADSKGVKKVDTILTDGDAADQILRAIRERGADCVVIGSRGLSDVKALFLGSVSHKVLNRAPCTCITVK